MATKGLKSRYPSWGFGAIAMKRLYWPGTKLTAEEKASGWEVCANHRSCRDVAPGFVPGFPHSHRDNKGKL